MASCENIIKQKPMNILSRALPALISLIIGITSLGIAQERVIIDQVVGVVGTSAILQSDLMAQRQQIEAQGVDLGPNPYCVLLDDMMFQKLLFNQALIDSIEVSESQVEQEIERRLRFFIQQIGSRERLEEYYGRTVEELREEFREPIREQEISRRMEAQVTRNVTITPSEVREFFINIPEDSIPMVESEMQLAKIFIEPTISQAEKDMIKERLEGFRQRVLDGESFRTLAILYSEDPGSARNGGELGFYSRGDLHPEFEAVAFSLRPGEVSDIVETRSGYHIIQLISRRGELVNVRHILLQPKVSPELEQETRNKLDSIRTLVMEGEMTFAEAARSFSDHPGGLNGGVMINPYTSTTRFRSDEIDPRVFFVVDRLEEGQISRPIETMTEGGRQAYQIVKVLERIDPHPANLQQDYDFIQQLALQRKKQQTVKRWVERRLQTTYIYVHEEFQHCTFEVGWLKK